MEWWLLVIYIHHMCLLIFIDYYLFFQRFSLFGVHIVGTTFLILSSERPQWYALVELHAQPIRTQPEFQKLPNNYWYVPALSNSEKVNWIERVDCPYYEWCHNWIERDWSEGGLLPTISNRNLATHFDCSSKSMWKSFRIGCEDRFVFRHFD